MSVDYKRRFVVDYNIYAQCYEVIDRVGLNEVMSYHKLRHDALFHAHHLELAYIRAAQLVAEKMKGEDTYT